MKLKLNLAIASILLALVAPQASAASGCAMEGVGSLKMHGDLHDAEGTWWDASCTDRIDFLNMSMNGNWVRGTFAGDHAGKFFVSEANGDEPLCGLMYDGTDEWVIWEDGEVDTADGIVTFSCDGAGFNGSLSLSFLA